MRIKKLLSIYNVKNKKILELGAATGAIGKILSKYGANVTISDARAFLLEKIKSKNLTKIMNLQVLRYSIPRFQSPYKMEI